MNEKEITEYKGKILSVYENFNLLSNIRQYQIRAALAKGKINPLLSVQSIQQNDTNTLYILKKT